MAGHSKWKQIKRKKAVTDARRASSWTKVIREITVAAKSGGGDPGGNPRLRTAIDAAKAVNMPNDNIDRAIKKGTGELEGSVYEELTYEGYGPGGAAIFIEATTDNANRTVAEIRHAFSRNGGNLGASNSVAWMFDRKGQIYLDATRQDEDATLEAALEAGAEDFGREGDQFVVTTAPVTFHAVQDALRARNIELDSAELAMVPRNTVKVEGADADRIIRLVEVLEELDDVSKVFSNFDIDAAQLAEAGT
ncbi:MAG: YebC/PmpR family DNA-binding transcriptional regulator [Gemmatimonadales bacterium]|nr:YebC/PmpR family DNA-binding transcriptional regulator [Gemmatimonadales bacterium]MBA3554528.1 YebC/PmpR family DNA-binding transcriptional regulator [Gemmatimonadales bacterium]